MALTRPQFVLPYVFTEDMTVQLRLTEEGEDPTTSTLTLDVGTSLTRYNNRVGSTSSDLLTWIAGQMNSEDDDGVWTSSEVSGNIAGRARLNNVSRADGKTVDQLTFGGGLTGAMLGYAANVVSVSAPTAIDGPFVRGRLWIPHSDSVEPLGMIDDAHDEVTLVESVTPAAQIVQDDYGRITIRRIVISPIDASFMKSFYAADSDYLLEDHTVLDPNAPFDQFCKEWISLSGDSKICKYYQDSSLSAFGVLANTSTVDILPMAEWLANVELAAEVISEAPLMYQLDIECWEA